MLVVNDNADTREALEHVLRTRGYTVLHASDGQEALDALRAGAAPCIILLDLMMPGMDGFQFRQEQLRDDDLAHIPVVVLSAVDDIGTTAAKVPANAYVQITSSTRLLLEQIQQHCLK